MGIHLSLGLLWQRPVIMSSSRICIGALFGLIVLSLWGCSSGPKVPYFTAKKETWRDTSERACLRSGMVRESPFIRSRSALGGPSVCGALRPFKMAAAHGGRVQFKPPALLRCPMVPQVDRWVAEVVTPAAYRYLGAGVANIKVAASYSCRPINGTPGRKLSEHGHANAIDISKFQLTNGYEVTVKKGWRGSRGEQRFLRAIHRGACGYFTTVLGPNYNRQHHDHFHFDLARRRTRNGVKPFCK